MTSNVKIKQVRNLSELRLLLAQDENGLKKYVYPKLTFGDVWWIPDEASRFGDKEKHPWVIVRSYSPTRAYVAACPRTTQTIDSQHGIITPSEVLPDLDKTGLFLLEHRRLFIAKDFRSFDYIGKLPCHWIEKIRSFYQNRAQSKASR